MSKKVIKDKLYAKGLPIEIYTEDYQSEFISLTDIAKYKSDEPSAVIANWLRNRNTIEFLGLWESLNNLDFKPVEFDGFRNNAILIDQGIEQSERILTLNKFAKKQLTSIEKLNTNTLKELE